MRIIEIIIIIATLIAFVDALDRKHGIYDWFHKRCANTGSKLLYRLSSCQFCIRFHLGWILFVLFSILDLFNITYLLIPFGVAGLLKIINYDNRT